MRTAKRSILVCAVCLLTAAGAAAQTVTAGVKAGAALTSIPNAGQVFDQISDAESVDVSAKFGLTLGGFVQFAFSDRFSLQPEMLFTMKGARLDLAENIGEVKVNINYLELPLLVRFNRMLNDVLRGYVMGGPALSIKMGTSASFEGSQAGTDLNIDPAITSRDFSLVFGGGLERERFLLEARYALGLSDMATDFYFHEDSLRNRAFSVLVGVRLP
jgi:hypothetical protein